MHYLNMRFYQVDSKPIMMSVQSLIFQCPCMSLVLCKQLYTELSTFSPDKTFVEMKSKTKLHGKHFLLTAKCQISVQQR